MKSRILIQVSEKKSRFNLSNFKLIVLLLLHVSDDDEALAQPEKITNGIHNIHLNGTATSSSNDESEK